MKDTVILCCTSLKDYVEHVQAKLNTNIPVKYLSRLYHRDPSEMREHIIQALKEIHAAGNSDETVLVAMGYCGGSWKKVFAPCRIVIPRVDDCISLLLQQGDAPVSNLKEEGSLYVKDKDPGKESFRRIFESLSEGLDEATIARYHNDWKELYSTITIIETEINNAHRPAYREAVQVDADWLDADMNMVRGSTHILEKLLSGVWDDQFLIVEPGDTVDTSLTSSSTIGIEKSR